MQVRPDRRLDTATFRAGIPVVSEPRHDAAERLGARIEARPAGMVLEAGERAPFSRIELALQEDVADHPALACDRLVRKEPCARHERAVAAAVAPAE